MPQTFRPISAELRVFRSEFGAHLFVVEGSRIYDVDAEMARAIERSGADGNGGEELKRQLGAALGLGAPSPWAIDADPPSLPPLRSISLNVAQSCNMACSYCYADEGRFGGPARAMDRATAEAAIDRLILESEPGARLTLGFMGGEPLLNRDVLHHATRYASAAADRHGREMRFSLTTNATLLRPEDARLFHDHPFSVQISLDGQRFQNDEARPMKNGRSAHDHVMKALELMNGPGRPMQLAARATVTPKTRGLPARLDHLISLGFDEAGFAPVLASPSSADAFTEAELDHFLDEMIACGTKAYHEIAAGRSYPFANFETALAEIHRGSHRPYACGAGAAYLSANADGRLFACHRLVDDARFLMGDVFAGLHDVRRAAHLQRTHVDGIEPCRGCWARYLCGGGCQHEVDRRGRIGCDYIRGWLEFCLGRYIELLSRRPDYFASGARPAEIGLASLTAG
ncbi:MAG TPA: radical SAM protein [Stellaceae bacterium]|nr:radical SAM protein [Stellaceae bacterium]